MKIWKARLLLFVNKEIEWETLFTFELKEDAYKYDGGDGWELYSDKKVIDFIPEYARLNKNLKYDGDIEVIQGFKHELKGMELQSIELKFREQLRKELDSHMDWYMKNYMNRTQSIYSKIR